jgi:serine/threonine protein kinase
MGNVSSPLLNIQRKRNEYGVVAYVKFEGIEHPVFVEEGGAVTAKIIDLGLAKAVNEQGSQTAISMPGGFVGTPDFASPEQFAGVQVDIRSDLYSLGATLWKMLTGQPPFRGTSAELMQMTLNDIGQGAQK